MDIAPIAPLLEKDFTPQVEKKSQLGEKTGSAVSGVDSLGPEKDFEKVLGQTITNKQGEQASGADAKSPAPASESNENLKTASNKARPYALFEQSLELLNDLNALSRNIFSNLINNDSKTLESLPSAEYQPFFSLQDSTTSTSADFSFINQMFTHLSNILHGSFDNTPVVSEAAIGDTQQTDSEVLSIDHGPGTLAGGVGNIPFSDRLQGHLSYRFSLLGSTDDSVPFKESFSLKAHYLSVFPASNFKTGIAEDIADLQLRPQEASQRLLGSLANSENSELQTVSQTSQPQPTTSMAVQRQASTVFTAKYFSIVIENAQTNNFVTAGRDQQRTSVLLDQLEKLVGQNNDKVAMTVSRSFSEKQGFPGYVQTSLGNHPASVTPGSDGVAPLNSQSTLPETIFQQNLELPQPSLRQEAQAPYLSAKITPADKQTENQSNTENAQQDTSGSKQQFSSSQPSSSTSGLNDTALTNTGFSSHIQGASQPLTESASATPTHGNQMPVMVQEDDVIQQLLQRFTLNPRLETSKMSLKLHPAELGELKIDVVVKQETLKATIFAQTQQAHDIIDKNLPRLKAILQEQGLTVDELFVSFESDSIENFDKQNNNLFQQQLNDFQQQNSSDASIAEQSFEESIQAAGQETLGVNLTV